MNIRKNLKNYTQYFHSLKTKYLIVFIILCLIVHVKCNVHFISLRERESIDCGFSGSFPESETLTVASSSDLFESVFRKVAYFANITDSDLLFEAYSDSISKPMAISKVSPIVNEFGIPEKIRIKYSLYVVKKLLTNDSVVKFLNSSGNYSWNTNDENFFNLLFIIFHELGHFLNSDPLKKRTCPDNASKIKEAELNADKFAGKMMYKLGINPEYNIFKVLYDYPPDNCYPKIEDRINYALAGIKESRSADLSQHTHEDIKVRPIIKYLEEPKYRGLYGKEYAYNIYLDRKDSLLYGMVLTDMISNSPDSSFEKIEDCYSFPDEYKNKILAGFSVKGGRKGVIQLYGQNPIVNYDTILLVHYVIRLDQRIQLLIKEIEDLNISEFNKKMIRFSLGDISKCSYYISNDGSYELIRDFSSYFRDEEEEKILEHADTIRIDSQFIFRTFTVYQLTSNYSSLKSNFVDYGFTVSNSDTCQGVFVPPSYQPIYFGHTRNDIAGLPISPTPDTSVLGYIFTKYSILHYNCF